MGVPASNLRPGLVIEWEGALWACVSAQHVKLAKGGGAIQAKMKNLTRGDHVNHRFRSSDKIEPAFLDKRNCEFLYPEGEQFVFMDEEDYEQYTLGNDLIGEAMKFVKHNARVVVTFYEGNPVTVDLPPSVELEVKETEPGHRGDTVSNVYKPATLETGLETKVPNHISIGDTIKVSTETGEFQERVNK
ncbi:MAG: elongation factor P [Planctomycetota bacterium]